LNPQAANAFLKTLEEPPQNSVLILLSTEPSRILETILSRCLRLNFSGDGRRELDSAEAEWLEKFGALAAGEQKSCWAVTACSTCCSRNWAKSVRGVDESADRPFAAGKIRRGGKGFARQMGGRIDRRHRGRISPPPRRSAAARPILAARCLAPHPLAAGEGFAGSRRSPARKRSPAGFRRARLENLQTLEQTQRLLHTNVQEALALEVSLLKLHF
jgi:DNA polymerase III subunit delta'